MSDQINQLPVAALERIDAACAKFETEWKAGTPLLIHELAADAHGDERVALLIELILLDIDYRRRLGDSPGMAEYTAAFPEVESRIEERHRDADATQPVAADNVVTEFVRVNPPDLPAGTVVASYVLQSVLGRGGMGTVYAAEHQHMKRMVALKIQKRQHAADDRQLKRFRQEAELIAQLSHSNIVIAHDAGDFDGRPFLVTELVDGSDLAKEVCASGPLPFDDAIRCIRDAASGLEYAHKQRIIHRDVKPSNLLRGSNGTIKVSDLGLARFRVPEPVNTPLDTSDTSPGMAMGTVDYMSPEQARDPSSADHRSDIYSLGCTLFYLLTGDRPYKGATALERLIAHNSAEIPDVTAHCENCPQWANELLKNMIAKNPGDRFQSMREVISAIDADFANEPALSAHGAKTQRQSAVARRVITSLLALAVCSATAFFLLFAPPASDRSDTTVTNHEGGNDESVSHEGSNETSQPAIPVIPYDNARQLQIEWAAALGIPLTVSAGDYEFVLIPPGEFEMGVTEEQLKQIRGQGSTQYPNKKFDELQHAVRIPSTYYMGKTEVTVDQFSRFVKATGHVTTVEFDRSNPGASGRPASIGYGREGDKWTRGPDFDWKNLGDVEVTGDMPVMNVSHHDAVAFTRWLCKADGPHHYRLPTQAEWEYACRGGTDTVWYYGDSPQAHGDYGWHAHNADSQAHGVATKQPNPFGLFDMYGNADEWCSDRYQKQPDKSLVSLKDGQVPHPSQYDTAAARGGWFLDNIDNRSTLQRLSIRSTAGLRGFRVLREVAAK